MAGLKTKADFEHYVQQDTAQRYIAFFAGCSLQSCFQPIFYRSGDIFGHEALLRVHDAAGQAIRPDVFLASLPAEQQIMADRLARVIHIRNFAASQEPGCLTLNLLPQTVLHEAGYQGDFSLLIGRLQALGIDSGRVLLEVMEYEVEEGNEALSAGLRMAVAAGLGIAVDDFGAMASVHGRVLALYPDLIKIDRSLLLDHMQGDNGHLAGALQMGWQVGSRMLVEGIETEAQYRAMFALGVELFQGYHLGRPAFLPVRRECE